MPEWFRNSTKVTHEDPGRQFRITDFGAVADSTIIQTSAIQKVIDSASEQGGRVIVIPAGTFMSGALFSKRVQVSGSMRERYSRVLTILLITR